MRTNGFRQSSKEKSSRQQCKLLFLAFSQIEPVLFVAYLHSAALVSICRCDYFFLTSFSFIYSFVYAVCLAIEKAPFRPMPTSGRGEAPASGSSQSSQNRRGRGGGWRGRGRGWNRSANGSPAGRGRGGKGGSFPIPALPINAKPSNLPSKYWPIYFPSSEDQSVRTSLLY